MGISGNGGPKSPKQKNTERQCPARIVTPPSIPGMKNGRISGKIVQVQWEYTNMTYD